MSRNRTATAPSVRRVTQCVFGLVATLLLTGCIRADVDLRIDRAGRVNGTVIIAFSSGLLQAVGQKRSDVIADVREASKDVPKGMKVEVYDVGMYVGERITFAGVPAEQFGQLVATAARGTGALGATTAQDFVLEKSSKRWRFFGTVDLTPAAMAAIPGVNGADLAALQKGTEIHIKITFPGIVTARDKSAKVSGKAISWNPKPGEHIQMQAVAKLG